MTNTVLLEKRIQDCGYKKKFLAARLGLSRHGFLRKVKGDCDFTATEVGILRDLLGITSLDDVSAIFFNHKVDL